MENPTHSFSETSLVLHFIWESQIKNKAVLSWSSRKKKEGTFCTVYFVYFCSCFLSMYSVLNTLSEHTYFNPSKNITLYTVLLVSSNRRKPSVYPRILDWWHFLILLTFDFVDAYLAYFDLYNISLIKR